MVHLGSFKLFLTFEIWYRLRVRVTKTIISAKKTKIGERKNFSNDLLLEHISHFQFLHVMLPFVGACHNCCPTIESILIDLASSVLVSQLISPTSLLHLTFLWSSNVK